MSKLAEAVSKIEVPTSELKLESIQALLLVSKNATVTNDNQELWNNIAVILWNHILTGINRLDDQLLCATCFYSVLTLTNKQDLYLAKILNIVKEELFLKEKDGNNSAKTYHVVSLMYGMFQSSFLVQTTNYYCKILEILKPVFVLLLLMGYEYSQWTFLAFKILKSFKKLCDSNYKAELFSENNIVKLLNFVNHNWENPVTGVRDMNRSIFQIVLYAMDDARFHRILKEINGFYWNKAKYLMLSEVVENEKVKCFIYFDDNEDSWVNGVINSLYKPGLVSAGADMYYAMLKIIDSLNHWCEIFLQKILNTFTSSNQKAVQNFINYWCLATFKKFPELANVLIEGLDKLDETGQLLYGKLCILKQAKKLDIKVASEDRMNIENVANGLVDSHDYLRAVAFDVVCMYSGKAIPSQLEYNRILDFIKNNVNSDCTVLRINMLNSLNFFLTQLHSIYLNIILKQENRKENDNLLEFCKSIQALVIESLNLNGNYQRKITCVKLCYTIWSCATEIPKKKKDKTRHVKITLVEYLKQKGFWLLSSPSFLKKILSLLKDPADDIRENVIKLLLHYYSSDLKQISMLQELIQDAKTTMKSKYFYEISCGQSMFKLIIQLVIDASLCHELQAIFSYAYNELIAAHKMKIDAMTSIENGKQLHSFMSIISVYLETCISKSLKVDLPMAEILSTLDTISNQFHWEEDNSTSSDFSKMNDMVEKIIADHGYDGNNESDPAKISGLHQILLNCLWLNVKGSCDLASVLLQLDDNDVATCEHCLKIITHVLETSRHKGAIEAAGVALGRSIHYLTSLPEDKEVSHLPSKLLKQKLNDWISETNKMSSITRRGAGLSIMVHRIVSSDMKRGKPLFHYFINTLLNVCNTAEVPGITELNQDNQVDLPKAIYIHFMTRIVTDSSLASDLMYYSAMLAELAFSNLTSTLWQIRNAALQLYGALIPRLIGQRKASGSDDETIATVACDELRTHSPKLWKYIIEQLKQNNNKNTLQNHSNLVPILNLLANIAERYNFSCDIMDQKDSDLILLSCLVTLLGSPIYTVRRLTAKCIFNIYNFDVISGLLEEALCDSENILHGCLILLYICHKRYNSVKINDYNLHFSKLKEKFDHILNSRPHSYLSKCLFQEIYLDEMNIEDVEEIILEVNKNASIPGVHIWAEVQLKTFIQKCSGQNIPKLMQLLLQQNDFEKYLEMIYPKTQSCDEIEILTEIVDILMSHKNKYSSSMTWKIIYNISLRIDLANKINTEDLIDSIKCKESLYNVRYIIPLIARLIPETENFPDFMTNFVEKLSNFECSDVEMRSIAATANNELAKRFNNIPDAVKVTAVKCAVMLLQDEDEEVRYISIEFYKLLNKHEHKLQAYISLNNIMSKEFLYGIFNSPQHSIQELCKEFTKVLQSNHAVDEYNPFTNDSRNIYFEQDTLKMLIDKLNDV